MIKKRLYKHNFLKGGPLIFEWTAEQVVNLDYAQLYPQVQTVHHVVPDTHVVDHNVILGEPSRGRSRIMEGMYEILDNLRNEGWTVTFDNETPNNPIDGYEVV